MARYKPVDRNPRLLPVVLSEQIQPGSFEFALDHLVEHELDLTALDARFHNDEVGASAYDPRVMLKIVLLAYSRGIVSSRSIESACLHNVQFIALSGDAQPSYTHIAKFVRELGEQIRPLFTQVLLTCDRLGLIGRQMFAIDGVKLPANASKERSGTHAELLHRAQRLEKAADKIIALHRSQDSKAERADDLDTRRQARIDELRREARATRDFVARSPKRTNKKGQELKTNVTDPDSAKMATSKGVIQGYAAQAAVDSAHQIIVAAEVTYTAKALDCEACQLSRQCLKGPLKPNDGRGRQVTRFEPKAKDSANPSERMRQAIDSARGRQLYSQRIGTVEPVFANLRHNKRLSRFTLRGKTKVGTQWQLYCLVHNIEKLAHRGYG